MMHCLSTTAPLLFLFGCRSVHLHGMRCRSQPQDKSSQGIILDLSSAPTSLRTVSPAMYPPTVTLSPWRILKGGGIGTPLMLRSIPLPNFDAPLVSANCRRWTGDLPLVTDLHSPALATAGDQLTTTAVCSPKQKKTRTGSSDSGPTWLTQGPTLSRIAAKLTSLLTVNNI